MSKKKSCTACDWMAGCACCGHRWETNVDWRNPVQCPKCSLFSFCYVCNHCGLMTFMPNGDGSCWNCRNTIHAMTSTAGFLGHLFSPKCPSCGNKDKVAQFPEYAAAGKDDFVTDIYDGGIYPTRKVGYQTDYFCAKCGRRWCTRRITERVKYG